MDYLDWEGSGRSLSLVLLGGLDVMDSRHEGGHERLHGGQRSLRLETVLLSLVAVLLSLR